MPHIHTEPGQHDHTASGYIIRTDGSEPKLMLHWHRKLNMWLQFGGHVELNETPWQTIAHELREESGYDLDQLMVLQPKLRVKSLSYSALHPLPLVDQTHKFKPDMEHYHIDRDYGFVTNQQPRHKPAETESTKIKLFSLKEVDKIPARDIAIDSLEIYKFILTNIDKWDQVPATDFKR